MTSPRDLRRRLDDLEASNFAEKAGIDPPEVDEEQIAELKREVRERLSDDECARLDELEEHLAGEGFSELGEQPTDVELEYFDLLFPASHSR